MLFLAIAGLFSQRVGSIVTAYVTLSQNSDCEACTGLLLATTKEWLECWCFPVADGVSSAYFMRL